MKPSSHSRPRLTVTRKVRLALLLSTLSLAMAAVALQAGSAGASSGFRLSIAPLSTTPSKKVVISTTPRQRCTLTVTMAGRRYNHLMPHGWIQVTLPPRDILGRVPVSVDCGGTVRTGAFTVHKP